MSDPTEVILARLDERSLNTQKDVHDIKKKLEENYVTQQEFRPMRLIFYGMVGSILLAFLGGVIAMVMK